MTPNTLALVAAAMSLLITLLLAIGDPKRRRQARRDRPGTHRRCPFVANVPRGVLACMMFAPGVALLGAGMWSSFLIWFAAVLVGGWLLALCLSWHSDIPPQSRQ